MIDLSVYKKHWPGKECWIELSSEFAAKHSKAEQKEAIAVLQAFVIEICNTQSTSTKTLEALMSSPLFDPNASFVHDEMRRNIPGDNPSLLRIPLVGMMYNNIGLSTRGTMLRSILPDGLVFPNGERVKDPNDSGSLMQPLYASMRNNFWNFKALLTHPDINPNLNESFNAQYYLQDNGSGRAVFSIDADREISGSPAEYVISTLDNISPETYSDTKWRNEYKKLCINAMCDLIDAGASLTLEMRESCDDYPKLNKKLVAIDERISNIIAGDVTDVTALDLKHAHAINRLGEVFLKAHEDVAIAQHVVAARDELPQWLQDNMHAGFDMLEGGLGGRWTHSTEIRRAAEKNGQTEKK